MNARLELSRATSVLDNYPAPEGKVYFPFQKAGIAFALLGESTLFADPPGLGKTIQLIGFMNARKIRKALITCPASLVGNWKKELQSWLVVPLKIEIFNPKKFRTLKDFASVDVLIFSYGYASNLSACAVVAKFFKFELIGMDEIHYLKEPKSKRTKHLLAPKGLASLAKYKHGLSGTPIVNRPIEIFPTIRALAPEAIGNKNYFEYGLRYCAGFKGQWGWDFSGASNLKELGEKLRSSVMVRRNKIDVLKDLPEKLPPNIVYLSQDRETARLVKRMSVFDPSDVIKGGVSAKFEELSEMRRELGVSKLPAAIEYIRTQLESGHDKIILFAHHKEVVAGLVAAFSDMNPAVIVGETPSERRQGEVNKFQTDKTSRLFIGSLGAASVGHTLTAASYVIFVEASWVSGENEQATDRAHRIGQRECVQSDYLVFENSLDVLILRDRKSVV